MPSLLGFARSRWWLVLSAAILFIGALGVAAWWLFSPHQTQLPPAPAPVLARVTSATPPTPGFSQLDITTGWRFQTDPGNAGEKAGWANAAFDDAKWGRLDAGDCWTNLGYPGYTGYAWYRRTVVPPIDWQGKPVYLSLKGADDELDVFVNGKPLAHYGDRAKNQPTWDERTTTRIDDHLTFGKPNMIAIRINNWAGDGGLCTLPVTLTTNGDVLLTGADYLRRLAELAPDSVFPAWARGADRAWTVAGPPGGPAAIVNEDGTAAAGSDAPTLTYWVYDLDSKQLIAPESVAVQHRLQDGYQPATETIWRENGLEGESRTLVVQPQPRPVVGLRERILRKLGLTRDVSEPTMLYRFRVMSTAAKNNGPRRLVVVAALRPYGANGQPRWLGSVEGAGDAVKVNGQLALVAGAPPAGFGAASLAGRDLSAMLRSGEFPTISRLDDPQGLATIGLEYPLTLAPGEWKDLVFQLPVGATAPAQTPTGVAAASADARIEAGRVDTLRALNFDAETARSRTELQAKLQRVSLNLPDQAYSNAFYASVGYMLANMRGETITSGPFAHNGMWYRDAAYVVPALLMAGVPEVAQPAIGRLQAGQLTSGEFPSALNLDGSPRWYERHEWDAQGQFVHTVWSTFRLTGDRAKMEAAYPSIARAMDFTIALSKGTRTPQNEGTPFYGLLPPSDSAEDLGLREWHHYWDDFWAIGGLREAADLARALGKADDAARFDREAADLQALVVRSIGLVQRQYGIDYIPNGPEDVTTSAMARGTTPAVWPLKLFAPDDPLLVRSFERYDEKWVKPQGNAYLHNSGNLWVYGGLEIAHSWMYLAEAGKAGAMVQWVMDNQTLPGTFAWAEAAKPITKLFSGGDMPHSWAAAEFVLYLRDSLVRESGDQLVLGDGIPAPWLGDGKRVEIHNAPTYFGKAGYSLVSHQDEGYWELTLDDGTAAPGGYLMRGPFPNAPVRAVVNGQDIKPTVGNALALPKDAKVVRIYFR